MLLKPGGRSWGRENPVLPPQEEYMPWEWCRRHLCYAIVRTGSPYRLHLGWGPVSTLTVVQSPYADGHLDGEEYTANRSVDLYRDDHVEDVDLVPRIQYWLYRTASDPLV